MEPFKRLTLVYAVFSFAPYLIDPVFALFLTNSGYEPIWLTLILSSYSLSLIFAAPLIGGISDTWGRRPIILAGIIMEAVAILSYVLFTHPIAIFVGRILEAVGYSAVTLVGIAKLEDMMSEKKEKQNSTVVGKILSIAIIGQVIGPLVGGFIANYYGFSAPFFVAVATLLVLLVWYFFQNHHVHPKPPLEKFTLNPIPLLKDFLSVRALRGLSIFTAVNQYSVPVFAVFLPIYMVNNLGLGIETVGIALFVKQVPMLFQFYAGKLTDVLGSRKTMIVGNVLCGISLVGLSLVHTLDWLMVMVFLFGVGSAILGISTLALLSSIAIQLKKEGTFLGGQISISKIGSFIGYFTAGIIVELGGIPALFLASGTLILVGLIGAEELAPPNTFNLPKPKTLLASLFHRP